MATTAPAPTATTTITEVTTWHVLSREDAVHELDVEPEAGLSSQTAAERLAAYGPNKFAEAKSEHTRHPAEAREAAATTRSGSANGNTKPSL